MLKLWNTAICRGIMWKVLKDWNMLEKYVKAMKDCNLRNKYVKATERLQFAGEVCEGYWKTALY